MLRQTVLLVYGGESEGREASIRSARSVYAAMDGEKYTTLLCYVDLNGKWWLLERWVDTLEEHGGTQLMAVLGSRSFLELPGNGIVRPDVVFPLLASGQENDQVVNLAKMLHVAVVAHPLEASFFSRHLEQGEYLDKANITLDTLTDTPDDTIAVAVMGTAKLPQCSIVAFVVAGQSVDEGLRSVVDETLQQEASKIAANIFTAFRCRGYALIKLHKYHEELRLGSIDMIPELSTSALFLKLWRMSGAHYPTVVDALIATARK